MKNKNYSTIIKIKKRKLESAIIPLPTIHICHIIT